MIVQLKLITDLNPKYLVWDCFVNLIVVSIEFQVGLITTDFITFFHFIIVGRNINEIHIKLKINQISSHINNILIHFLY